MHLSNDRDVRCDFRGQLQIAFPSASDLQGYPARDAPLRRCIRRSGEEDPAMTDLTVVVPILTNPDMNHRLKIA